MRDDHIDLCGQIDFTRTEAMPLLARECPVKDDRSEIYCR